MRERGKRCGFFSVKNGSKLCRGCGESKPESCFQVYTYITGGGSESVGISSKCKPCLKDARTTRIAKNPERYHAVSRRWREKNKEAVLEYSKRYGASERGRAVRAECQRLRDKRIKKGSLGLSQDEKQQIRAVYLEAKRIEGLIKVCPVFDDPFLCKKVHVDHIVPLSRGGPHHPSNLQLLLMRDNIRKWAR